ncbi:MAG: ImmA/IrrE family metallo-endopeptidase [Acidobacteria bacterium]|nr:ImmA/IrrE family metallo-endopeptidase [Acidobacteriota bacterium]
MLEKFCDHHGWTGAPEDLMVRLCADLLYEGEFGVPVDVRALASFRGALVEEADQPYAGLLTWDGARLVITVCASDSPERRRFTVCHEVCHTFLPGFREAPRTRLDRDVERFDHREPEEYLCDLGASELLLPRETFSGILPRSFGLDDVLRLASHFRASIEAAAIRCAALSIEPVAVLILEGTESHSLYVRRAATTLLPSIAAGAPVPGDVPLSRVLLEGEVSYRGRTGLILGTHSVQARSLPYARSGRRVERVLALLRPLPQE